MFFLERVRMEMLRREEVDEPLGTRLWETDSFIYLSS